MKELDYIVEYMAGLDTEYLWNTYADEYHVIQFSNDGTAVKLTGNINLEVGKCPGVYRLLWAGTTVYVGKSELSTMAKRIYSHTYSFINESSKSEVTGRKLREYMAENNLEDMLIQVQMVDMSKYATMISAFEQKSIQYYKPIFNTHYNERL